MSEINNVLPLFSFLLVAFGAAFGLYQYYRQWRFRRLQNLSAIFQKFIHTSELVELFDICDQIANGDESKIDDLSRYPSQQKLRLLGLLEEIALFAEESEVEEEYAKYLFAWHFEYVFGGKYPHIGKAFWSNLGTETERDEAYWSKSRNFAERNEHHLT